MDGHSKTLERYCCVMGKNVAMEETRLPGGHVRTRCMNHVLCAMNGGCKHKLFRVMMEEE